jgi:hypothetical protein
MVLALPSNTEPSYLCVMQIKSAVYLISSPDFENVHRLTGPNMRLLGEQCGPPCNNENFTALINHQRMVLADLSDKDLLR